MELDSANDGRNQSAAAKVEVRKEGRKEGVLVQMGLKESSDKITSDLRWNVEPFNFIQEKVSQKS